MTFDSKLNVLIAFPYFTKQILGELKTFKPDDYRLIVDSGAFSAYNSGEEIGLDDYCNFIKLLMQENLPLEAYVQLDVVFNEEKTLENYKIMKDRGFTPAPVFTRGSDEKYFHDLCEQGQYVFVGGVQKGLKNRNFAKWILEHSKQYKVHLLAFIKPEFINHYRPYSVDSSSWSSTSRFGALGVFIGDRIQTFKKQDFIKGPPRQVIEALRHLKISDAQISCLRFNDSWQSFEYKGEPVERDMIRPIKGLAQYLTILNWCYYSIMAQNKIGTKIYLAVGQSLHLSIVIAAYYNLKKNKLI